MAEIDRVRHQGEVVEWSDEKRCGFIRPRGAREGDPLVFLGIGALAHRRQLPKVGSILTYELTELPQAMDIRRRTHLRAENAAFLGEEAPDRPDKGRESFLLRLGLAYGVGLGVLSLATPYGRYLFVLSAVTSAVSFALYWRDKAAAKKEGNRVPELSLHLWAIAGGWPGAVWAQKRFRHKTRKTAFRIVFGATILANLMLTGLAMLLL